jgi:hypothetical protein
LFILAAFGWSSATGADHSDPLAPLCEHNRKEALALRLREERETWFMAGVPRVIDNQSEWVREGAHGLFERHAVRDSIVSGL